MSRVWKFANIEFHPGELPLIMGIVNVTPDSFSDGGQFFETELAVQHALSLVEQGAQIIDIGGESTRPGAESVTVEDEIHRVIPVIEALARQSSIPISIDTYKATVARRALDAGATIVNDISGLNFDKEMLAVCRDSDAGVICMHIQGTPQTMQNEPRYSDVVTEISGYFKQRLEELVKSGIAAERIVFDPGIGFGKTALHNLEILSHISRFHEVGRPVLIGHSRKRFLAKVIDRQVDERTFASVGISIALAVQGTDILRVHDVTAHRDALIAWHTVRKTQLHEDSHPLG
ncbi:MAG: dihydropteroate synthase [Planctomycetota bacterium]|nr:dihydropteroate synthase [Planctomycetota bacterium]MDA1215000.1 dihydropteroate synthase [Planctomycetota bacterium]